jgi:hypothetical protein
MSTKITQIYDQLHTIVGGLLTDHTQLPNPYFPEDTANQLLDKGWGLTLMEGSNTNRETTGLSMQRTIELILTRQTLSGDIITADAIAARKTAEKGLFESQIVIAKALQANSYLSQLGASKLIYNSDDGLNFVRGTNHGILILRSILEVEYFETL